MSFWIGLKEHALGLWNHMQVCRFCKWFIYAEIVILIIVYLRKCT